MARSTKSNGKRQRKAQRKNSPIYQPLDPAKKEIRILNIFPWLCKDRLVCSFDVVSLLTTPPPYYEAISWCWGKPSSRKDIILNGRVTTIPSTASDTIGRLCFNNGHYRIWIDAVCINQADIIERGHQVGLMLDVYEGAAQTLVWLGESNEGTEQAIASIEKILAWSGTQASSPEELWNIFFSSEGILNSADADFPDVNWYAILDFYSSPWFSRLWVCQEVMLGNTVLCFRGENSISWNKLSLAAQWMFYGNSGRYHSYSYAGILMASTLFHYEISHPSMASLLTLAMAQRTTLSLDKIYALLGIAKKHAATMNRLARLIPDYTQRLDIVYAAATRMAIEGLEESHNALGILQDAQNLFPRGINNSQESIDMWPSWVPRYDWSYNRVVGTSPSVQSVGVGSANGRPIEMRPEGEAALTLSFAGVIVGDVLSVRSVMSRLDAKNHTPLAVEVLRCRDEARELGVDEGGFALTLFAGNPTSYDAAIDNADFIKIYKSFISQCEARPVDDEAWSDAAERFAYNIWMASANKRFFTTTDLIGMAPPRTEKGDWLCIPFGSLVPIILRPDGDYWRLVGMAYAHGIMDGRYIRQLEDEGRLEAEKQVFHIR